MKKISMISSFFFPLSLFEKDVYVALVFGNLGTVIVSSICPFRGMGFFLYRGRITFKGRSGTSGSEA
jgi:hypothetical protein